ncbi:G-patch domain and KOW motifs-containing protein-like isoform X4 [Bombus affinis]|uniref:G-patch domain and KOW motifs-containing protein-like isoform X4 n=1 Tax=Bombus affinis TaxID=309941 RepID=UPI0021B79803|nr:G-patch domain and KOW motifs-containing protein-like isoform X4 [Bombus affinis]
MAEEGKKISFGFAKSIKKPVLKNAIPQEKKKVDYIECLDEKGIKVIGEEEKKDEPLIIPLLGSKTWHDRIVNKIDADIFLPKADKEKVGDASVNEAKSKLSNGKTSPIISIKKEPVEDSENKVVTLEEQAAKEIIEDLKSKNEHETKTNDLTLPLVEDESLRGKEQSTLEDYEKIPIDAFGVAMLRGMGWQPGKGIGRNEKLVAAVIPELRPKGMGLGADKVALQKKNTDSKKEKEEVKIEKGTFVKIIAGKQNTKKYEEYKDKESKGLEQKMDRKRSMSPDPEDGEDGDKSSNKRKKIGSTMHNKNKYDKVGDKKSERRKRRSESNDDSDSDSEKKRRRERSNSNRNDSYKLKRLKKSKKHKKHDCSSERSSKKHKKKDKERENVRDKKPRDYADRKKHKRRERSRSRSFSRQ